MGAENLAVFTRAYDFTMWMMGHTQKFPKSSRFTLAARLENRLLDFMESVLRANRARDKGPDLRQADGALEAARILARMGKDMRFLSLSSYEHAAREMDEMGRMLGGWIKSQGKVG